MRFGDMWQLLLTMKLPEAIEFPRTRIVCDF